MIIQRRHWDSQPQEIVYPNYSIGSWGTLVNCATWTHDLVTRTPITNFNATYRMEQSVGIVGKVVRPVSNTNIAAATWVPMSDMGALAGSSAFWHGVITQASGNANQIGLFGRLATTSGGAGYAGQFFLRVNTSGNIVVQINFGAGPVSYTSSLVVSYNVPLTFLVHFNAASVDIISTVGNETISTSTMPTAIGSFTTGTGATIGADRWDYTGHPYQQTALTGWSRTRLPNFLLQNPYHSLEPESFYIPIIASSGNAYTLTASSGSYNLTGQQATLKRGKKVYASSGSYNIAGQTSNILKTKILSASSGTYSLNGQDAIITKTVPSTNYELIASAGTYSLSGESATLLKSKVIDATQGTYSVAGKNATIAYSGANTIVLKAGSWLRYRIIQ